MQRSSDGTISVLPITALEAIALNDRTYVFVGSGTDLRIIEAQTRVSGDPKTIFECQVFDFQAIHGFSVIQSQKQSQHFVYVDAFVYGGRALAWIRVRVTAVSNATDRVECVIDGVAKTNLPQWILVGKTMLTQSSPKTLGTILTSHNVLIRSSIDHLTELGVQELSYVTLSNQLPAFLYSADIFVVTEESYIIASGTAFGEILTWTCTFDIQSQTWLTRPWKEFRGHLGSIFGLSISTSFLVKGQSQRLLVSSSDDRTIRLWDISEIDRMLSIETTTISDRCGPHHTFTTCNSDLAMVWAHDSRIWDVDVEVQEELDPTCCAITSIGEDCQVVRWHVDLRDGLNCGRKLMMKNFQNDRYHVGKNISAYCNLDYMMFSGGADGQLICRKRRNYTSIDQQSSQTFHEVMTAVVNDHIASKSSALRSYRLIDDAEDQFLACTDRGSLIRCTLEEGQRKWQTLAQDSFNKSIILASKIVRRYAFFIQTSSALLTTINLETKQVIPVCNLLRASIARLDLLSSSASSTDTCLATTYHGNHEIVLTWVSMNEDRFVTKRSYLQVPDTFVLTSIHFDADTDLVICGSRAGAIAVYTCVNQQHERVAAAACIRHVHGSDTVTSIQPLKQIISEHGDRTAFYLTTGRDGYFCIVSVLQPNSNVSDPIVRVVHRSESFLGRHLEGAYLLSQPDQPHNMILYGFHADNFVVWNETKQMHLMEVACGGAHREWDFNIHATLNDLSTGTLVWTKGKTVNVCTSNLEDHSILQSGGHGREIKALAVHQRSQHSWLIATGSEDTNIRLFEYDKTGIQNVSVLTRHKAGLQDLEFSEDGQHLMSAAGMEELLAWRLRPVPVIKLGVVCTASLTSPESTADARLMALDMVTVNDTTASFAYHILAAFSNGKVRQIAYSETDDTASFSILAQLDMGSICLTQSQFLTSSTNALIASTNGSITALDLSDSRTITSKSRHKIHQNNVTVLSTSPLFTDSTSTLIVTGGDDNALALTLSTAQDYSTVLVPKAHAAALTALAVYQLLGQRQMFVVVTAGNDQRLNVWTTGVVDGKVGVGFVDSLYTNVADISQIAILDVKDNGEICEMNVLVVGVGMESVRVSIPITKNIT